MTVTAILETLASAGLSVSMLDDGRIGVSPASRLTNQLRDLIRAQKSVIVDALKPVKLPEPPIDPATWRELAEAYYSHHFKCRTCSAAGLGYGPRCGTGIALWSSYAQHNLGSQA